MDIIAEDLQNLIIEQTNRIVELQLENIALKRALSEKDSSEKEEVKS